MKHQYGCIQNRGFPPKSSILVGVFHYFHHPFWGTPIFGNTYMHNYTGHDYLPAKPPVFFDQAAAFPINAPQQ